MDDSGSNPMHDLGYLLQHVASALGRQSDQILQERLGVGYSQFKIMLVLQANPRLLQRHIAENLGQTEASISRQIHLMHDDGLLQTTISPQNRREHITTLTPKGIRLTEEAQRILNHYYDPMLEALGEKQQRKLLDLLVRVHHEICKGDRPHRCHQTYLD